MEMRVELSRSRQYLGIKVARKLQKQESREIGNLVIFLYLVQGNQKLD